MIKYLQLVFVFGWIHLLLLYISTQHTGLVSHICWLHGHKVQGLIIKIMELHSCRIIGLCKWEEKKTTTTESTKKPFNGVDSKRSNGWETFRESHVAYMFLRVISNGWRWKMKKVDGKKRELGAIGRLSTYEWSQSFTTFSTCFFTWRVCLLLFQFPLLLCQQ